MSDGLDIYHPNSRRHLCTTVHRCPLEDHSSPVRQGVKSYFKGLLFGVNIYIILYAYLSGDDMNWEPTRWQDVKGLPEGARVQTTSRQRWRPHSSRTTSGIQRRKDRSRSATTLVRSRTVYLSLTRSIWRVPQWLRFAILNVGMILSSVRRRSPAREHESRTVILNFGTPFSLLGPTFFQKGASLSRRSDVLAKRNISCPSMELSSRKPAPLSLERLAWNGCPDQILGASLAKWNGRSNWRNEVDTLARILHEPQKKTTCEQVGFSCKRLCDSQKEWPSLL